jgi:hypothetical protein
MIEGTKIINITNQQETVITGIEDVYMTNQTLIKHPSHFNIFFCKLLNVFRSRTNKRICTEIR